MPTGNGNTYIVTVTDGNNCSSQQSFIVTQPLAIVVSATISGVSCHGGTNGAINISTSGGVGSFNYLWSNSSTVEDQINLVANSYTVTATDVNGCTRVRTFNVNEPLAVAVNGVITHVSCNGGSDGAIDVTTTGGTGVPTYLWSNSSTIEDQTNLILGNYTVTATDVNGCTGVQSFGVTEPQPITIDFTPDNADCNLNNGSITALAQGGTGTFSYRWNTNALTATIINLAANTYTCTVTDQNTCSASDQIAIVNSGAPVVTASSVSSGSEIAR